MKRALGAALVVSAVVLAGCGDDDDDAEATTSSAPPSSSVTSPTDEVLPVPSPRDASRLITDPCSAFTADQLAGFGITEPGKLGTKPSAGAPEKCSWDAPDLFSPSPSIDILVQQFSAAEFASGSLDTGLNDRVERVEIGGNPAALQQVFREDTRCEADVLIAPTQVLVFGLDRNGDQPADPCVPARELAEIAVGNLPPLG